MQRYFKTTYFFAFFLLFLLPLEIRVMIKGLSASFSNLRQPPAFPRREKLCKRNPPVPHFDQR